MNKIYKYFKIIIIIISSLCIFIGVVNLLNYSRIKSNQGNYSIDEYYKCFKESESIGQNKPDCLDLNYRWDKYRNNSFYILATGILLSLFFLLLIKLLKFKKEKRKKHPK